MTARKNTPNPTAAEALGESVPVEFQGVTYQVPPTSEWEYAWLVDLEAGRVIKFLTAVLGKDQHDAFVATKPKAPALGEFIATIQRDLGVQGN